MTHTPNVRKTAQTWGNVLEKAKEWFALLSKTGQQAEPYMQENRLSIQNILNREPVANCD